MPTQPSHYIFNLDQHVSNGTSSPRWFQLCQLGRIKYIQPDQSILILIQWSGLNSKEHIFKTANAPGWSFCLLTYVQILVESLALRASLVSSESPILPLASLLELQSRWRSSAWELSPPVSPRSEDSNHLIWSSNPKSQTSRFKNMKGIGGCITDLPKIGSDDHSRSTAVWSFWHGSIRFQSELPPTTMAHCLGLRGQPIGILLKWRLTKRVDWMPVTFLESEW